jgi:hypothetical protein
LLTGEDPEDGETIGDEVEADEEDEGVFNIIYAAPTPINTISTKPTINQILYDIPFIK